MGKYFITGFEIGNHQRANGCHTRGMQCCFCFYLFAVLLYTKGFKSGYLLFCLSKCGVAPPGIDISWLLSAETAHSLFCFIIYKSAAGIYRNQVRIIGILLMSTVHCCGTKASERK